jgi:hypothetical protein
VTRIYKPGSAEHRRASRRASGQAGKGSRRRLPHNEALYEAGYDAAFAPTKAERDAAAQRWEELRRESQG